jgi:hypothetical protein
MVCRPVLAVAFAVLGVLPVAAADPVPVPAPARPSPPAPAASLPGFYLEEELIKQGTGPSPEIESTRTWIAAGRMRKEQEPSGSVTIFREDRKTMWVLDPRQKTYFALSREALERMGELGMSALAGDHPDPEQWLRRTGNKKRIGAWDCYEVRAEDRPLPGTRISLWLSPDVPIDRALRDQFGSGTLAGGSTAGKLLSGLKGLEGYPVEVELTARLGTQILELRQTLKKVEKRDVAAVLFEPPADYREVASPLSPAAAGAAPTPVPR